MENGKTKINFAENHFFVNPIRASLRILNEKVTN